MSNPKTIFKDNHLQILMQKIEKSNEQPQEIFETDLGPQAEGD